MSALLLHFQAGSYEDLVKYLLMVRKKAKDSKIDTELVYAYAKTKQLGPLEEFISSPNQANLQVRLCMIVCFTCLQAQHPQVLCAILHRSAFA